MRYLSPLLILGLVALNGCTNVNIEGKDGHARFPEGEIVVVLDKVDRNDPKRRYNAISAGYVRTEGDNEQTVDAGDYIDVDGVQVFGPTTMENDLKLSVGYLRFVRHMFVNQHFEWNWGAGLGYSKLNYTGTPLAPQQQVSFEDSAIGLHGQIGLAYHIAPQVAIEGAIGGYAFSSDYDSELFTSQVVFALKPVEAIRLFAGYRRWQYYFSGNNGMSDIDYLFSGPTAGLTLSF